MQAIMDVWSQSQLNITAKRQALRLISQTLCSEDSHQLYVDAMSEYLGLDGWQPHENDLYWQIR